MKVTYFFLFFFSSDGQDFLGVVSPATSRAFRPAASLLRRLLWWESLLGPARGTVRPRSDSPFIRNVRGKIEEEEESQDLEAVACLLDFSMRDAVIKKTVTPTQNTSPEMVTVRTFSTIPRTSAAASRPDRPPRIVSGDPCLGTSPALEPFYHLL